MERHEDIFLGDWEISYYNLQPEIFDPFVFEPPVNCELVQSGSIRAHELKRMEQRAGDGMRPKHHSSRRHGNH